MRVATYGFTAVALALWLGGGFLFGHIQDDAHTKELKFQIVAPPDAATWRVARIDALGEVFLKYEGFGDAAMQAIEGYFLVLPVADDPMYFLRVLITEVDHN